MKTEPKIIIIAGLPGSGKSTAAKIIAQKLKINIFTTDKIWREKEFFPQAIKYHNQNRFFPEALRRKFYKKLMKHGEQEILSGKSVILDGTFSNLWTRQYAFSLARKLKAKIIPLEIRLNKIKESELIKRTQKRIKKDGLAADHTFYWLYKKHHRQTGEGFIIINNDGSLNDLKFKINKLIKKI